jgi:hypothetical protein
MRPKYLIPWCVFVSAFQAASIVNIGGTFPIGISPYFFVASLIAIRLSLAWISGRLNFKRDDMALDILRPLLMLMVWGAFSAFILPVLFRGLDVDTPRLGMDPVSTTPLEWSMSNAAQAGYLLLNGAFLIYMLWQSDQKSYVDRVSAAFIAAGVAAMIVGVYQLAAHVFDFPFPADVFNSNSGWQQLVSQKVAGAFRVSATFNEPSSAGTFFAAWTAYLLILATDARSSNRWVWGLFWCGVVMLVLTTSTTAYVTAIILAFLLASGEFLRVFAKGRIDKRIALSFVAILAALGVAILFIPDFGQLLADILWRKNQTHSGQERASTIVVALGVTMRSLGLGVGLGSNRPSGMFFYILSNLGVPGCILIAAILFATFRVVRYANQCRHRDSNPTNAYLRASSWAFAMLFLAMLISGADISFPHLWILWSMVVAFGRYSAVVTAERGTDAVSEIPSSQARAGKVLVLLTPELRA